MNKKQIYTTICEVYELNGKRDNASLRRFISRHLKTEYGERTWNELSHIEQQRFTYILMREPLFTYYVQDEKDQKRINKKIEKEIDNTFLDIDIKLNERNDINSRIYVPFYEDNATDEEKEAAYEQFCKDYKTLKEASEPPTYKKWLEQNENKCLRLYDYIMSESQEETIRDTTENSDSLQSEIDYYTIQTIIKIFKDELGIEINLPRIRECLTFLHNYEAGDEYAEQLIEYDPTLPLSKEEQNEIISMNRQHIQYQKMCNDLNFYTKKEKD